MKVQDLIKKIFKRRKSKVLVKDLIRGKRYCCVKWIYGIGGLYIRAGTILIFLNKNSEGQYRFRIPGTCKIVSTWTEEIEKYMEEVKK